MTPELPQWAQERVREMSEQVQTGALDGRVEGWFAGARSTPGDFADCAEVTDKRGKVWKYSEPADVWRLVDGHLGPGSVILSSARSYQRLVAEFGPLDRS